MFLHITHWVSGNKNNTISTLKEITVRYRERQEKVFKYGKIGAVKSISIGHNENKERIDQESWALVSTQPLFSSLPLATPASLTGPLFSSLAKWHSWTKWSPVFLSILKFYGPITFLIHWATVSLIHSINIYWGSTLCQTLLLSCCQNHTTC